MVSFKQTEQEQMESKSQAKQKEEEARLDVYSLCVASPPSLVVSAVLWGVPRKGSLTCLWKSVAFFNTETDFVNRNQASSRSRVD